MKTTEKNRQELTEEQVLNFLSDLFNGGNAAISCTGGNGGAGLDISITDFTDSLAGMTFNGQVTPYSDFESWEGYNTEEYTAYQWSDVNGFNIQVLVW